MPHGNVVEVRLLPRCVTLGSSNPRTATGRQHQHRSVSRHLGRFACRPFGQIRSLYHDGALRKPKQTRSVNVLRKVHPGGNFILFSSLDGTRKVWDGRLFSLFVMCDRSLRTVPCHSFYGVSKIEVTGESLANVRTKWEAIEQRAQPFFEDHYDWPESIPHIPGLV